VNCFTYALLPADYTYQRHNELITENGHQHTPEEKAMIRTFSLTSLAFVGVALPFLTVQMFGF
jgi:hypothetical protein